MGILRSEYPRPDLVRERWLTLNGEWQFAFAPDEVERPEDVTFDRQITVPFVFQSKLSGIGDRAPHTTVWYKRSFEVPEEWRDREIILHFGAVDYESIVWINGEYAGTHRGGYIPFSLNITRLLCSAENEVVVKVVDRDVSWQPRGKQSANRENWGCWYTRSTGIWQSVWLEPVSPVHLNHLRMIPDIDREMLFVEYELANLQEGLEVEFITSFQGERVGTLTLPVPVRFSGYSDLVPRPENRAAISVSNPKLWSPEDPNLYGLTIIVRKDGRVCDQVRTYFGMRKIESRGNRIYLNNKPYYLRMVLDQGFWPDGIYTPKSIGEYERDVRLMKECGFNGARKHQKIEDPYFYHTCDRLGLLVWAEMPSCYIYDEENVLCITQEWLQVVRRNYNFPSIMAWVPMNESWGVESLIDSISSQFLAN